MRLGFCLLWWCSQPYPTICNPCTVALQVSPSIIHSQSLLILMPFESMVLSNRLIFCRLLPPPTFCPSQHQGLFQLVSSSYQVAKVLEFQYQHQVFQWVFRTDFLQDGLVGSPCSSRDSQESPPTPQAKSINSSALSFLYSTTLTSVHDYRKNHNLDYMDLCWHSDVSTF